MEKILDQDLLIKQLETLKHSRQIWFQNDHERLLQACGFIRRPSRGDSPHITFEHKSGRSFTYMPYHKGNDNYLLNRDVANACLKTLSQKEESCLKTSFANNGHHKPAIKKYALPENLRGYITAEEQENSIIFRHKKYPCIGFVTSRNPTEGETKTAAAHIVECVKEFCSTLESLKKSCGIKAQQDENGDWIIYQNTYKIGEIIRAYDPEDSATSIECLEKMQSDIEEFDQDYSTPIKEMIDEARAARMAHSHQLPDGSIEWTVTFAHFISDEKRDFKIILSRDGRVELEDFYKLTDQRFSFDFGDYRQPKYLQKILEKHLGFKVERPPAPGKKLGDFLKLSHPIFDDLECNIPVPSEIKQRTPLWNQYQATRDPEEEKTLKMELNQIQNQRDVLWRTLNDLVDYVNDLTAENKPLIDKYLAMAGPNFRDIDEEPRDAEPGQLFNLVFHYHDRLRVCVPAVKIQTVKDGRMTQGDILNYETLRSTVDQAVKKIDKSAPAYNHQRVLNLAPI